LNVVGFRQLFADPECVIFTDWFKWIRIRFG